MKLVGKRWLVAVLVCGGAVIWSGAAGEAQVAAPRARVVSAPQSDKMVMLHGNVHPMARPANDRGTLADQQPVTRVHLLLQRSPEQEAALQQLMADQLDPKSARFHQWLTPQQFGEQFGPADSDIQAVKGWLSAQGFTGMKVNNGKTMIEFSGTAGQIRNALRTEIHHLSVNGEEHFANWSEPQIPAALAPVVAGVVGLNNFRPKPLVKRFGTFQRNLASGEITPLFTYTNVNGGTFYGVGPSDFAKIYNLPATSTLDGTGASIALVGRTNINVQDVNDFRSLFGLPAKTPQIVLNGADPGIVSTSEEGEAILDTEWSGAVAPGANIMLVVSQSTDTDGIDGVDASAIYIVDNNLADIMSESFGTCEANLGSGGTSFYSALWQQASAQGITVSVSSGDNGSAGCDPPINSASETSASQGLGVSGIASTPYNVALGGTDFDQVGKQTTFWNTCSGTPCSTTGPTLSAKGYIPEMTWNDSCASAGSTSGCATATATTTLNFVAGSGGASAFNSKPVWQTGVSGIPSDGHRDLPDVSLFSSDGGPLDSTQNSSVRSFYIVCQSDQDIVGDTGCSLTKFVNGQPCGDGSLSCNHDFQGVGGTSAAAPTFAGIMALIKQKTGQRQGNPNPVLYTLAKNETYANCNSSSFTNPASAPPASCVFMDITKGNISVACTGGTANCSSTGTGVGVMATSNGGSTLAYPAGSAYDLATGLGSINVTNLANAWTSVGASGAATSISLTPPSITGTAGTVSGNLSGTVSGGSGTPTGVVILENSSSGAPVASGLLNSSAKFTIAGNLLPQGTYTLKAHYSGDGTSAPSDSTSTTTVSLTKQASKVLVSFVTFDSSNNAILHTSAQSVQYGSDYILRVDVQNNNGTSCQNSSASIVFVCPTGTVSLFDGGSGHPLSDFPNAQTPNSSSTARLNDRGFAEDQPIQLNAGSHTITAAYTADSGSSYTSQASSNSLAVTITQATTATAVVSNTPSVTSGQSVTLTATVSSGSNSSQGPSGTVQFLVGGTSLGSAATCTAAGATTNNAGNFVGASCTATLTTALSSLPPGFYIPRPKPMPFAILNWLAAILASISLLLATRTANRKRQFAYAATVLALLSAAAVSGCGGGGGGGGGGSARAISGKYSGDANYATSTSTAVTVTVH